MNEYRYGIYRLKENREKQKEELNKKINLLRLNHEKEVKQIKSEIISYRNSLFEAKNKLQVDIEKISFAYKVNTNKIIEKTKNEYIIEYNQVLKGIKNASNRKKQGILESAALSKEAKNTHRNRLIEDYNRKIEKANEEFLPKIEERSKKLLSKDECKLQLDLIKLEYKSRKSELIQVHDNFVNKLEKPNHDKIKNEIKQENSKLKIGIAKAKKQSKELSCTKGKEFSKKSLSKKNDQEKLSVIRDDYKKFKADCKKIISNSKQQQNSEQVIKNVQKMQMIFQDPISSLNPRMTVKEIVAEGLIINGEKNKEIITKKVIEALELVGLAPEYISRYPHEFSGGQRQRIGIARALIMNPSVIVADEPISALDVSIKAQVINLLRELREKLDLTMLFIAHDLSIVKFFCDRIAVMYYGKIVELTSSEELFKHPLHGYTKSLLSAIPNPDPDSEKQRKRITYSSQNHDYSEDKPEFVEITKNHFVLANKKELLEMKKELGVNND